MPIAKTERPVVNQYRTDGRRLVEVVNVLSRGVDNIQVVRVRDVASEEQFDIPIRTIRFWRIIKPASSSQLQCDERKGEFGLVV